MVIDIILDRMADVKDGTDDWTYEKAKDLYESADEFGFIDLSYALEYLEEEDIKMELCRYIDEGGYKPSIKKFINSVSWISPDWI